MTDERGKFNLFYKTDITDKEYKLNKTHFITTKLPLAKTVLCSIEFDMNNDILVELKQVLLENRKTIYKKKQRASW